MTLFVPPVYSSEVYSIMDALWFWTFKIPRLSSALEDSPVVNKYPRTKIQELEDACYLVVDINLLV